MQQTTIGRPKLVPTVNVVQMNEGDDYDEEENDVEDDQHMVSILLRIKQAKAALEESRQRKNSEKLIAESEEKLKRDVKSEIYKFKGKWTKKFESVTAQINALKNKSLDIEERANTLFQHRRHAIAQKEKELKVISNNLQELFEQLAASSASQDAFVANELEIVRKEIQGNIAEVEQLVRRIEKDKENGNGDKLSKLMKSIMTDI